MPNDEAIERAACAAYAAHVGEAVFEDGMRAAISAYFADVPVSEAVVDVGVMASCSAWDAEQVRRWLPLIFKAMCAKHAEELSNGR